MTELPADRRAHLEWLLNLTALPPGGLAVDLGCGRGDDLRLLAQRYQSSDARFIGVDKFSDHAFSITAFGDARITFRAAALDGRLPFEDATVDLVYSHNLMECLPDPGKFASEVVRGPMPRRRRPHQSADEHQLRVTVVWTRERARHAEPGEARLGVR